MDIYLDANATTPVLGAARAAALAAMAEDFGNPSSTHAAGLKARALVDAVRARARQVLGATSGQLIFLSGATEGIQTAVLSALNHWRGQRDAGAAVPPLLLVGATEHKAVPQAVQHWNALLGLNLQLLEIPVGPDGRHDLAWLRAHAPRAALVCTMAANNETGVVSDLDGIQAALAASPALWLVDGVQALGKLALTLHSRRVHYAPFSGHKLYAPKGIGLLYVREDAPFTPLLAGGGQEQAQRSGTENMPGIAALGAVLAALDDGKSFREHATLLAFRARLVAALEAAFPGLVFNAPLALCLPTTLNFSVPGLDSRVLLDLFDAAGLRISGGSACSAARAEPSPVLQAMGLAPWQAASALRLSFGPAEDAVFINEACARIRACGASLRQSCLGVGTDEGLAPGFEQTLEPASESALALQAAPLHPLTRLVADGACCYLLADTASRRCVVIDPLPQHTPRLLQLLQCQQLVLAAVLHTGAADAAQPARAAALQLRVAAAGANAGAAGAVDVSGWPLLAPHITLGARRLERLHLPAAQQVMQAYVLHDTHDSQHPLGPPSVFVGAAVLAFAPTWHTLEQAVGRRALLLPAFDAEQHFADTLASVDADADDDAAKAAARAPELQPAALAELLQAQPRLQLVDVREPYEQRLGGAAALAPGAACQAVPLSALPGALAGWLAAPEAPLLFVCRSGGRSAQAAAALRRLGRGQVWSLAGGLALWPAAPVTLPMTAPAPGVAHAAVVS